MAICGIPGCTESVIENSTEGWSKIFGRFGMLALCFYGADFCAKRYKWQKDLAEHYHHKAISAGAWHGLYNSVKSEKHQDELGSKLIKELYKTPLKKEYAPPASHQAKINLLKDPKKSMT